ncbi:IS110 family transposase [Candidatus Tisiphia endosymbiont of Mystacides longicornis]|uniref:IS110 family transposase n=1 Tax=Candidatus Tisiphia endosymbiont of Mystacides longicornis TaxID=3139330 RepID=UPI003CCB5C1C
MEYNIIGIDLAKNIFHLHAVDKYGKNIFKKKLTREKFLDFMANQPKSLVGMEACGGSNHWAREITKFDHDVKLMAPQFVKPYVKSNKNNFKDAEAICEAVGRPTMRFVPIKSVEQQDVLSIHRVRERLVKNRTALANEIRGLLHEFGITIPRGVNKIISHVNTAMDGNKLSNKSKETFCLLLEEFRDNNKRIIDLEKRLNQIAKNNENHAKLMAIPGLGLITATALTASIGNAANFENGRQLSAWLGLVPKQHSTGGKERLLGISKRGDVYLRNLLIHGVRSVFTVRVLRTKKLDKVTDDKSKFTDWMLKLQERRGYNTSVVAVANKLARVVFAVLRNDQPYSETKVCY